MLNFFTLGKERVFKAAKKGGGLAGCPRRKVTDDYARLTRLSNAQTTIVRKALFKGIKAFKRRIDKTAIAAAWDKGDTHHILALIPWNDLHKDLEDATKEITETVMRASDVSLKRIKEIARVPVAKARKPSRKEFEAMGRKLSLGPNENENLRFDVTNPQLRGYLNSRTAQMIKYVENDAKTVVQGFITRTFTEGMSGKTVAENLKGSIGLLPQHERALEKYKGGLRDGGMSATKVEQLGNAYEEKLLDYRVDMIAKTEVRLATNFGQLAVWKESAAQGFVDKDRALKEWVVDGDPCEICEPMDEVRVGIYETWEIEYPDGDTAAVDIPTESHPHCMCGMEIVFNDEGDEGDENESSD